MLSLYCALGAQVYIRVKPYNSYCVESLYVGFEGSSARRDGITPQQNDYMRAYLSHHGLDDTTFTQLVQGKFPTRKFLPLPGQLFRGIVKEVKRSRGSDGADIAVIEAHIGLLEPLIVEVPRSRFSVYGHWMTKADLRYLIENGKLCFIGYFIELFSNQLYIFLAEKVLFEYNPSLDTNRNDGRPASYPEASLVWLGNVDDRPVYVGRSTQVNITPNMDSSLWSFVASKKMDEKMFRAMVCEVIVKSLFVCRIFSNPKRHFTEILFFIRVLSSFRSRGDFRQNPRKPRVPSLVLYRLAVKP